MLTQLNAYLLRPEIIPLHTIGDAKKNPPQMYQWDGQNLTDLADSDSDLLEAAVDGDMIVMTFRRPGSIPRWKTLLEQNFGFEARRGNDSEGAISLIHEARRMQALGYRPSVAVLSCF